MKKLLAKEVLLGATVAAVFLFLSGQPRAQNREMLYVTQRTPGPNFATLLVVDPLTGLTVNSSMMSFSGRGPTSVGRHLYALKPFAGELVVSIDPANGAVTTIGSTGLATLSNGGIAFDSATAALYVIGSVSGGFPVPPELYRLDRKTLAATSLGSFSGSTQVPFTLAFDSRGRAFVADRPSEIHSLDLGSLKTTLLGDLGISIAGNFRDLAFDSQDQLWGVYEDFSAGPVLGASGVYRIDLAALPREWCRSFQASPWMALPLPLTAAVPCIALPRQISRVASQR